MAHDKFIRFTHIDAKDGNITRSPIFVDPKDIQQICDNCIYMAGNYSFTVVEKAEQIHDAVIRKLEENKQAETIG